MRRVAEIAAVVSFLAYAAWSIVLGVMFFASACGGLKVTPAPILPPNVAEACARGVECGVFLAEQMPECIACLETVADKWNAEAKKQYGDATLPLRDVPCEYVAAVAHQTRLSSCVAGRWYGP